jgi:hypothetical protein
MPKLDPSIDEYTLLCERCGYVIEGLATDGACPECGKPIAESLPERRVGTPWQQASSWRSYWRTTWQTLRHPKRTLGRLRIEDASRDLLTVRHLSMASLLVTLPTVGVFGVVTYLAVQDSMASDWEISSFLFALLLGVMVVVVLGVTMWCIGTVVLYALVAIERRGLRLLGRTHGYRMTPAITVNVCSHGAVGWLVGCLCLSLMISMLIAAASMGLTSGGLFRIVFVGLGIGSMAGFVFFEWFAWLGLRRCKFANRARAER